MIRFPSAVHPIVLSAGLLRSEKTTWSRRNSPSDPRINHAICRHIGPCRSGQSSSSSKKLMLFGEFNSRAATRRLHFSVRNSRLVQDKPPKPNANINIGLKQPLAQSLLPHTQSRINNLDWSPFGSTVSLALRDRAYSRIPKVRWVLGVGLALGRFSMGLGTNRREFRRKALSAFPKLERSVANVELDF